MEETLTAMHITLPRPNESMSSQNPLLSQPMPGARTTGDIRHGFVYERVQQITLQSIAHIPDIREKRFR